MSLLDELKQRVSFRKDPPVVYNIEDVGPPSGWSEQLDSYGRVVRLDFNCSACHRGQNWCHPRLEPLVGEFAFAHCGRVDLFVIGQGPVPSKTRDPEKQTA
jgi:hypothetical protein